MLPWLLLSGAIFIPRAEYHHRCCHHARFLFLAEFPIKHKYKVNLSPWITPCRRDSCLCLEGCRAEEQTKTTQAAVIVFRRDGPFILLNPNRTMRKLNKATVTPCSSSTSSNSDEELRLYLVEAPAPASSSPSVGPSRSGTGNIHDMKSTV